MFFPVKSTWLAAILRGAFATWPYITYNAVQKYLLPSPITSKGHIKQTPTKLRSTKKSTSGKPVSSTSSMSSKEPTIANILQATINLANKLDRTTFPTLTQQPIHNTTWNEHNEESTEEPTDKPAAEPTAASRTNEVFIKVVDLQAKVYSDQTGVFPHISSQGYRYLMIFYDYDTNAIFVRPLKTKTSVELNSNIVDIIKHLTKRGFAPKYWILDNECSKDMKNSFTTLNITFQLVPAGMHRCNTAERMIQSFKTHFITGLVSVDPNFPMHLWDKLVDQAEATINMLRQSRIHPHLSAYDAINGTFNLTRLRWLPQE